jgi:tRNA (guanine-N(7)-)-methyltransferase subunit TRM82
MPKRPCAITLTPDNATILVGDKFGDVYGLPLIAPASDSDIAKALQEEPKPAPRPFKPSATDLTVHTVRNRKALDAQIKQSVTNTAPKQTEELNFAHELLLGHVAMLTNIICISVTDSFGMGKQTDRTYIITADRDEHIRVSRGPPQAHIIDSYCFGHTSFVSSLCIVPQSYNRILVSGGGDDFLLVWDLLTSRIIARIDLRAAMKKFWATLPIRRRKSKKQLAQAANDDAMLLHDSREAMGKEEQSTNPEELVDEQVDDEVNEKIAVVGLWAEPMPSDGKPPLLPHGAELYCALEGIPAILQFQIPMNASDLGRDGKMLTRIHATILPLSGNPLDAVFTGNGDQMFVCVDNIHEPGSTTEVRRKPGIRMEVVETIGETHFDPKEKLLEKLTTVEVAEDEKELKALRDLLYSTENLRKRGGEEP